jgi:hypothetical protein
VSEKIVITMETLRQSTRYTEVTVPLLFVQSTNRGRERFNRRDIKTTDKRQALNNKIQREILREEIERMRRQDKSN